MDPILWTCAYTFGAAVTGAWSVGLQGIGRTVTDRVALAAVVLLWPLSLLFAAGMAIADWREVR